MNYFGVLAVSDIKLLKIAFVKKKTYTYLVIFSYNKITGLYFMSGCTEMGYAGSVKWVNSIDVTEINQQTDRLVNSFSLFSFPRLSTQG